LQYWMWWLVIKKHKNHTEYQNIAFVKSYIIILLYNQWEEKNVIQINDIRITT
jgi:hypothetical protein